MRFIEKAGCTSRRRRLWSGPSDITRAVGPSTTSSSRKAGAHSKLAALDPEHVLVRLEPEQVDEAERSGAHLDHRSELPAHLHQRRPEITDEPPQEPDLVGRSGRTGPASVMVR